MGTLRRGFGNGTGFNGPGTAYEIFQNETFQVEFQQFWGYIGFKLYYNRDRVMNVRLANSNIRSRKFKLRLEKAFY